MGSRQWPEKSAKKSLKLTNHQSVLMAKAFPDWDFLVFHQMIGFCPFC
jgi:hypothetical protein